MAPNSTPDPIKLVFEDRVRVAGETIAGRVDLNVALAQEMHIQRLWIKFRGGIKTLCPCTACLGSPSAWLNAPVPKQLIREKQSLWTPGTTFPKAGSQVLSCSFEFQIPEKSHPSFHCSSDTHTGAISYSLEVVAERHGESAPSSSLRYFA
ncbi:hypothetical protein B0H19DRAFT_941290 [Mycena capillaripes]|nr:hypothetical protein B0H19DRAFT_941290 [Mycena capillaripes]